MSYYSTYVLISFRNSIWNLWNYVLGCAKYYQMTFHFLFQLRSTRSIRMWKNHTALLHSWPKKIKFWRNLGTWGQTRNKGLWCTWQKSWIYATRDSFIRRVHYQRNNDVLWLDIWNAIQRNLWKTAVSVKFFRFT